MVTPDRPRRLLAKIFIIGRVGEAIRPIIVRVAVVIRSVAAGILDFFVVTKGGRSSSFSDLRYGWIFGWDGCYLIFFFSLVFRLKFFNVAGGWGFFAAHTTVTRNVAGNVVRDFRFGHRKIVVWLDFDIIFVNAEFRLVIICGVNRVIGGE
jgi:hypothetical protein